MEPKGAFTVVKMQAKPAARATVAIFYKFKAFIA
jgi:hypothetical protein